MLMMGKAQETPPLNFEKTPETRKCSCLMQRICDTFLCVETK